MQEVMNKIVDAEQKALSMRNAALNEAKLAQAEAVRQGKDLLDKARKSGLESAKQVLDDAQAQSQALLKDAAEQAVRKADALKKENQEKIRAASRFVMERIVDSV